MHANQAVHRAPQKPKRPRYAREMDDGEAFLHDPRHGGFVPAPEDDVEAIGEEFVLAATSNEDHDLTSREAFESLHFERLDYEDDEELYEGLD